MAATHYRALYGTTDEQLAAVSVKNHGNGVHNPRAARRRAVTVDDVLSSRPIADPLTVLQCCGNHRASWGCCSGALAGRRFLLDGCKRRLLLGSWLGGCLLLDGRLGGLLLVSCPLLGWLQRRQRRLAVQAEACR